MNASDLHDALPVAALPADLDLRLTSRRPARLAEPTLRYASLAPVPVAPPPGGRPAASIIVVAYDGLPFTKLCLACVLSNTDLPYELIVINNCSTDGTTDYLCALASRNPHVRLVANDTNRGFAPANNQGLAIASGESLVLLNNDTIVPPGWLKRLLAPLADDAVGLVGPTTNRIGNEAEVETDYSTYGEMTGYAAVRAARFGEAAFDLPRPAMFCVALRRATFDGLGPLDEQFDVGLFEDDDYAMRAAAAGLRTVCAEAAFVHHFGEASFGNLFADGRRSALFEENCRRFERKWGLAWQPHARRRGADREELRDRLGSMLAAAVTVGTKVAVLSKGDQALLDLLCDRGLHACHFPQSPDGEYAGFHPVDGDDALRALREIWSQGFSHLLIPLPSLWWLDHYQSFAHYLRGNAVRIAGDAATGLLFALPADGRFPAAQTVASSNRSSNG